MNKVELLYLADLITQVFTTEAAGTFYVAPSKGKTPTGKLCSCINNIRNVLAHVDLIARESPHLFQA